MILCKDCANFIRDGSKCARSSTPPDYVYGTPTKNYSAQTERESNLAGDCGPNARHFILKQAEAA